MIRWLCIVTEEDMNSSEECLNLGNVYRIENLGGLVIQKEWKKVPAKVNVKIFRLVVVQPESGPGQYEVRN